MNLALMAGSLLVCLVVAEVVLAVVKVNTKSILRFVPGKGLTYVPGAYYRVEKEGASHGYINSHGFRDRDRSWEKPPGTYRILVLGDSYTEAFQVPLEESFPFLMEQELNRESGGIRYEVLNLGHSGFGTADAYMRYVHFGRRYQPDLVLLAFYLGNDFRNNSKTLNLDHPGYYFRPDGDGDLVVDDTAIRDYTERLGPLRRSFQWLKRRSHLASLLSERWFLLRKQARERRAAAEVAVDPSDSAAGNEPAPDSFEPLDPFSDFNVFLADPPEPWLEAIEITGRALVRFRDTVAADGAEFSIVGLAPAESVHPELQQVLDRRFGLELDYRRPDRLLRALAETAGIPYLGLDEPLLEYHLRTGEYLHGFGRWLGGGHWNEKGHEVASREIVRFLRKEILPQP